MKNKKQVYFQLFYAFFPPYYLIGMTIATLFLINGGKSQSFAYMLFHIILLFFFIKVSVILHECGHLIFGKIAGGKPQYTILGVGHEIVRFKWSGVKITVNHKLNMGLAFATFTKKPFLKLRYLLYLSGGFLTNLMMVALMLLLFGFHPESIRGKGGFDPAFSFILANSLSFVITIIPYHTKYRGIKLKSDGLSIIQLPFIDSENITVDTNDIEILDAYDYFQDKNYEKASELYKKLLNSKQDMVRLQAAFNLACIELNNVQPEQAFASFQALKNPEDTKYLDNYNSVWNSNVTWCYLLMENRDLEKAEEHAKMAFEAAPSVPQIQHTKGVVLIEKGDWEEGLKILKPLVDFEFANDVTITSAMYVCYGLYQQNKFKSARRYYDFVVKHISETTPLDRYIWDHMIDRLKAIAEEKRALGE
ncbi:hypothetical protein BKI52_06135 [marine bacterium AO1-C]|nr:hypothetical protein BKI52_06135 [marine bacterium AO1-C]